MTNRPKPQNLTGPSPSKSQHKPAKKQRNGVPPPQRERILQKYVAGKSIVAISAEEGRNRETVAKIVKGEEMQQFVQQMRERFFGIGDDAIERVRLAVRTEKEGGRLAYQLLQDIGVVPDRLAQLQIAVTNPAIEEMDSAEEIARILIAEGLKRNKFFGHEMKMEEFIDAEADKNTEVQQVKSENKKETKKTSLAEELASRSREVPGE